MTSRRRLFESPLIGTLLVLVFALVAAPAGPAAKPLKGQFEPLPPSFTIPAGLGCPFEVLAEGSGEPAMFWSFNDGREMVKGEAWYSFTNTLTGKSVVWHSSPRGLFTFDPLANAIQADIAGSLWTSLWPGDQGPFGEVGADGALIGTLGHVTYTADADTQVFTAFSVDGDVTDLCALISGV